MTFSVGHGFVFGFLAGSGTMDSSSRPPFSSRGRPTTRCNNQDDKKLHCLGDTVLASSDLFSELQLAGLSLCHGILHASGIRRLSDVRWLTPLQLSEMGLDSFDLRVLHRLIEEQTYQCRESSNQPSLSTAVNDAFHSKPSSSEKSLSKASHQNFCIEIVSEEHDIFRGRLFTEAQCQQINQMAEYHAYGEVGTIGGGWTNELYTLTSLHMQCKEVPALIATLQPLLKQLKQDLYTIFPGRIVSDSIRLESDGEPHLVKYHGKSKGTALHIDNSKFLGITINAMLSSDDDFSGGGTYIKAIDKTILLTQGEMLIHLGDLEHSGVEINAGVRRILVCFLTCEWSKEAENKLKDE